MIINGLPVTAAAVIVGGGASAIAAAVAAEVQVVAVDVGVILCDGLMSKDMVVVTPTVRLHFYARCGHRICETEKKKKIADILRETQIKHQRTEYE